MVPVRTDLASKKKSVEKVSRIKKVRVSVAYRYS